MMMWWLFEIEVIEKTNTFLTPISSFFVKFLCKFQNTKLVYRRTQGPVRHDRSTRISTFSHQKSSHGPSHMNRPLAIHLDIPYGDPSYKRKLVSFEINSNIVVSIFEFLYS